MTRKYIILYQWPESIYRNVRVFCVQVLCIYIYANYNLFERVSKEFLKRDCILYNILLLLNKYYNYVVFQAFVALEYTYNSIGHDLPPSSTLSPLCTIIPIGQYYIIVIVYRRSSASLFIYHAREHYIYYLMTKKGRTAFT